MTDFMLIDTPTGVSRFAMETAAAADNRSDRAVR